MTPRERRLFVTSADPDELPADRFLPSLAGVLGPGAVLAQRIPFVEADPIVARARAVLETGESAVVERVWPADEREAVAAFLDRLGAVIGDTAGLYFSIRWPSLGALRVSPHAFLVRAPALAMGGFGALLTTLDGTEGCRVDRRDGGGLVVTIWGERWHGFARMDLGAAG